MLGKRQKHQASTKSQTCKSCVQETCVHSASGLGNILISLFHYTSLPPDAITLSRTFPYVVWSCSVRKGYPVSSETSSKLKYTCREELTGICLPRISKMSCLYNTAPDTCKPLPLFTVALEYPCPASCVFAPGIVAGPAGLQV